MPQLDLYIWSLNVFLMFFIFIFLYFFVLFFFIVNIARVLFFKKFYLNYFNFLNMFIIKYEYIFINGLFINSFIDLIKLKQNLYSKISFVIDYFFKFYFTNFLIKSEGIILLFYNLYLNIIKLFLLK